MDDDDEPELTECNNVSHASGDIKEDPQPVATSLLESYTTNSPVAIADDGRHHVASLHAAVPSTSCDTEESVKCAASLTKISGAHSSDHDMECGVSSPTVERRPRSLTKGEVPTFYSLSTSPPLKPSAAVSRPARCADKRKNTARKTAKSSAPSCKKTSVSEKSDGGNADDRRLTFVVKKTGSAKEHSAVLSSPEKTQSMSRIRSVLDGRDADVEDIMDQNEEILQDVSGFSELFDDDEDSNTLVASCILNDNSNSTIVPDRALRSTSDAPWNVSNGGTANEKMGADNAYSSATDLQAGNVTSLAVIDMELTSVSTSESPALFESVRANATPETTCTASSLATDPKPESHNAMQTAEQEHPKEKPLVTRTQSKSRKAATDSKLAAAYDDNLDSRSTSVNRLSEAESQLLVNSSQEPVTLRRKQSARAHSKNRKTPAVTEPPVLSSYSTGDKGVENLDDGQDCRSKTLASAQHSSAETATEAHQKNHGSLVSKSSSEQRVSVDGKVEDQTVEVLPKKVAAYVSKPGKIVYSTAQRSSTSGNSAAAKSRSKSRSILPLQSKPRSKQMSVAASLPVDSPSSVFVFDGTPKEDTVCRPAAMLAARQRNISMDDSVLVSAPAEKPPVVRQRSLSAGTRKATDDDISASPHGILLVLHNGKRTKPRTARSKSVRYGTSETVSTPPPQHKQSNVPLTPYAKAAEHTSSNSSDLGTAVAGIVPESPVFTSASPVQRSVTGDRSKSDLNVADSNLENVGKLAPKEKANLDKVLFYFFLYFNY